MSAALASISEAVGAAVGCAPPDRTGVPPRSPVTPAVVQRHRVGALLHASGWGAAGSVPEETRAKLVRDAGHARLRSRQAVALHDELVTLLEGVGVPVLVLKGTVVAARAHGDVARRHVGDLDLLVGPAQVSAAVAHLREAGFSPARIDMPADCVEPAGTLAAVLSDPRRYPLLKAISLRRDPGEHLELHWRLFRNEHLLPVDPAWLASPERIDVAGVGTPVLPLEVLWRYLLAHGADDRWVRLKWLADVPALALRHPQLVSPAALRAIEHDGLERCVAGGLRLAELVLGRFLPDHARAWAGAVAGTRPLVDLSLLALKRDERIEVVPAPEIVRHVAAQLTMRRGARYRCAEALRLLWQAGRAHTEPDPGLTALVRGPGRWARRLARRTLSPS